MDAAYLSDLKILCLYFRHGNDEMAAEGNADET
jgi:hypothetical protein